MHIGVSQGHQLVGAWLSDYKFQGVSSLNQLEAAGLARPTEVANSKQKDRGQDAKLAQAYALRDNVQRRFDKARKNRAEVYSQYIEQVEHGDRAGGTPAITLYFPNQLQAVVDGRDVVVPYGYPLVAIDGETQTEARFLLRLRLPESGRSPVAFTLYSGIPEGAAQQILHDYNRYCHPVTEKQTVTLNAVGPLSKVVNAAIKAASIKPDQINRFGNCGSKKHLLSFNQIINAATGYAMGMQALEKGCSGWFSLLNTYGSSSSPLKPDTQGVLVSLINSVKDNPAACKAASLVWQVAGVALQSNGHTPDSLCWQEAVDALNSAKKTKAKVPDKLKSVFAAIGGHK